MNRNAGSPSIARSAPDDGRGSCGSRRRVASPRRRAGHNQIRAIRFWAKLMIEEIILAERHVKSLGGPAKQSDQLIVGQKMPVLANDRDIDPAELIGRDLDLGRQTHRFADRRDLGGLTTHHLGHPVEVRQLPVPPDELMQPIGKMRFGDSLEAGRFAPIAGNRKSPAARPPAAPARKNLRSMGNAPSQSETCPGSRPNPVSSRLYRISPRESRASPGGLQSPDCGWRIHGYGWRIESDSGVPMMKPAGWPCPHPSSAIRPPGTRLCNPPESFFWRFVKSLRIKRFTANEEDEYKSIRTVLERPSKRTDPRSVFDSSSSASSSSAVKPLDFRASPAHRERRRYSNQRALIDLGPGFDP